MLFHLILQQKLRNTLGYLSSKPPTLNFKERDDLGGVFLDKAGLMIRVLRCAVDRLVVIGGLSRGDSVLEEGLRVQGSGFKV